MSRRKYGDDYEDVDVGNILYDLISEGERDYQILLREFVDDKRYYLGFTTSKREANVYARLYNLSRLAEEFGLDDIAEFIRDHISTRLDLGWSIEGRGRKLLYSLFVGTVSISQSEVVGEG